MTNKTTSLLFMGLFFCGMFAFSSVAEAKPKIIVCKKNTTDYSGRGMKNYYFTRSDCGGFKPGKRYVGAASEVHVCGGTVTFKVMNGRNAGIQVWANGACGHVALGAVYHRLPNTRDF